jgi:WD40 repeat protein
VEFSADFKRVLSAGHDKTIRVWELETGRCIEKLKGRGLFVAASWLPDEKGIIACDEQAGVYTWL